MPPLVDRPADRVTLHSSWTGIVMASLGVVILLAVAIGVLTQAVNIVGVVIAGLAFVGAVVVLFDMPIASTFDADGVERHTPLRRHRLAWSDIEEVQRARRSLRRPGGDRSTGLVAIRGIRHTLLVDRTEGRREYEDLEAAIGEPTFSDVFLDVGAPPENRTPTWMYRRRKWRPEGR